ncbi:fibropellin-1-like [Dreissena polymorpha]|uniref:EGF-like domain-containing protein n=1 Tax=Dreissena polymorpha TaxID=45954 RepID=A0A9D4IMI3_DREPO|nr:fibropellin-1-like [Dreissena polymorpha]KAH3778177.1 hypothetical protein DPMN_179630 [Dreissena polymorpha]
MMNFRTLCVTFLGHVLLLTAVRGANTICFNCKNLSDPNGCKTFGDCQAGQKCYKETVEAEDGSAVYNWGCASTVLCTLENSIAGRKKRIGVERCFECCDSNFCNFGGCSKDYCSTITCQNGASCTNTELKGVCHCRPGYTGRYCETEITECSSNPCQNGAMCNDYINFFNCSCRPGFTGAMCEININECASSPCQNQATCVDGVNGYTCSCRPGYTGVHCETNMNECQSQPCRNGGTCRDLVDNYTCACIPGITGRNCEIDINDCQNVTCQNGGTCVDYIHAFKCQCLLGFTGMYCETSLGRVCYTCDDIDTVDACRNQTICGQGEQCYMEHELFAKGDFNFNLGCVQTDMCSVLQGQGQGRRYGGQGHERNTKPIQLCYECCDTNGCNHHACVDSRG